MSNQFHSQAGAILIAIIVRVADNYRPIARTSPQLSLINEIIMHSVNWVFQDTLPPICRSIRRSYVERTDINCKRISVLLSAFLKECHRIVTIKSYKIKKNSLVSSRL